MNGGLPGQILAQRTEHKSWEYYAKTWGETCYCNAPAELIVQGETDSFGYEANPLCTACHEKENKEVKERRWSCDWCKKPDQVVHPKRDYDEGSHGPVYYVCGPCAAKYNKSMDEEYNRENDY